ncbi:hypothetical protein SPI_01306 [Niveomyces insectorum RCEF 264]|uniref:Uncharacterized protein n=1 Tax=Niveomyces insectorum RCEF 264 TaxID=1081102 RepID=A0A162MTJ2_9HYPO|nr:hypothetical protein SPI_01306 [Niveomyces insectorum RCEF 264]
MKILVHIAAPSAASDDAKYRTLAQAYADFEPAGRYDIVSTPPHSSSCDGEDRQPGGRPCETSGGGVLSFTSLSFASVWDNVGSPGVASVPRLRGAPSGLAGGVEDAAGFGPTVTKRPSQERLPTRRQPYVSAIDVIPDSQPDSDSKTGGPSLLEDDFDRVFCRPEDGAGISEPSEGGSVGDNTQGSDSGSIMLGVFAKDAPSQDLSMFPRDDKPKTPRSRSPFRSQVFSFPSSLPRSPLSQRTANERQPAQALDEGEPKTSMVFFGSEAVSSSIVVPSQDSHQHQPPSFCSGGIPSSFPEEAGKVVSSAEDCPSRLVEMLPAPAPGEANVLRADSEPIHRKRSRPPSRAVESEKTLGKPTGGNALRSVFSRSTSDVVLQHKRQKTVDDPARLLPAVADSGTNACETGLLFENAATELASQSIAQLLPPSSDPSTNEQDPYGDTSLRIVSPEPPIACTHVDAASLLTDKLAKLARDLDLAKRYRPSTPASTGHAKRRRTVRPLERGSWRVNTSSWPLALRRQAWAFLAEYVGRGDAGWSVWCSRDPAPHTWLRLHCFAAVAGHTYLLLYLASQRHVLPTGAVWLDGTCTATITVPPRKRRYHGVTDMLD